MTETKEYSKALMIASEKSAKDICILLQETGKKLISFSVLLEMAGQKDLANLILVITATWFRHTNDIINLICFSIIESNEGNSTKLDVLNEKLAATLSAVRTMETATATKNAEQIKEALTVLDDFIKTSSVAESVPKEDLKDNLKKALEEYRDKRKQAIIRKGGLN